MVRFNIKLIAMIVCGLLAVAVCSMFIINTMGQANASSDAAANKAIESVKQFTEKSDVKVKHSQLSDTYYGKTY